MKNTYFNLINQNLPIPQEGFNLEEGQLTFHGISIKHLIDKYGTPFRLFYLPEISAKIKKARTLFQKAINKYQYKGKYHYCYCTKCNHFSHIISSALKKRMCQLETSSSFDIDLIINLYKEQK